MIHVIATIEIQAQQRQAFLDAFHRIVPLVREEEGCLEYGPTIDVETQIPAQPPARENVVTVVEKWESLEALEAHLMAPHMMEYRKEVRSIVVGTTLQILQPA